MINRRIIRVVIHGHVQGVGFRAWTQEEAERRGLIGWVRNRRDGCVEALFAGPPDAVTAMVDACRRGPPGAQVGEVDESEAAPETPHGHRFAVMKTV